MQHQKKKPHEVSYMHWVIDLFGTVSFGAACGVAAWTVWSFTWDWCARLRRKYEQRQWDKQYIEYELATLSFTEEMRRGHSTN